MWHLTKYARFVETATTSSESKNTWEVIYADLKIKMEGQNCPNEK
jgi:hypothetical protein